MGNFLELKPESEEAWLELRTKVLTATEVGVILGLNPWKSVAKLIEDKKEVKILDNAYIWMGQTLEPVVVAAANKAMDRDFKLYENGSRSFFADFEMGMGATPDAGDEEALLECKTTKPGNHLRWAHWPPAYYLSQLYCQMYCIGKDIGYLAIMSTNLTQKSAELNLPLHIFELRRTKELDTFLETEVKRFWDTRAENKTYRVNRKQVPEIELRLRFAMEKIR